MKELAKSVIEAAIEKGVMISTAESCTGGMIAAALTDIAGSSAAFDRGVVTYSNEAKAEMLGVPLEHTVDPGAVSALVAEEMVIGALTHSNADFAVAVTGIAGPGGGSTQKPIGLVYIAVGTGGKATEVKECRFADTHQCTTRSGIRVATTETALNMLLAEIHR